MKPNTLLISADGTYPGIVTAEVNEYFVHVKWYKWGYASKDFMDGNEMISNIADLIAAPAQVKAKFGALPPEYVDPAAAFFKHKEALSEQIQRSLQQSADGVEREIRSRAAWIMAEATDGDEYTQEAAIQSLVNYVLRLRK